MNRRNTFHKEERLCGKLRIANLYKVGKHYTAYPLRLTYSIGKEVFGGTDGNVSASGASRTKILVWAPKSKFKQAVMRNYLRRLMREAYRLNVHSLRAACQDEHCYVEMAFNYIGSSPCDYAQMEKAMRKALLYVENKIKSPHA
ncbi:MAG TPA: hypothetical protein DIW30_06015 [Bacteroidales bacterium]|nr:hypothetical protein [Bacteroidales bacterium]